MNYWRPTLVVEMFNFRKEDKKNIKQLTIKLTNKGM